MSGGADQDGDPSLYFFARGLGPVPAEADELEEEEEEEPTKLNTVNTAGEFLSVSLEKLSLKYTTANWPATVKWLVYYFEMFVKNAGAKGQVAIRFTSGSFKMSWKPGWE